MAVDPPRAGTDHQLGILIRGERVEGPSFSTVKVLDFGLARPLVDTATRASTGPVLLGTPPYMAPEQLRGEAPSRSSHLAILTLLGEGSRARAYLAEWRLPGEGFAVVKRRKEGASAAPLNAGDVERLLALDHPHVGTMYDAGVDAQGRGYAITDYVPGVPITRYCEEARRSLALRVELLLQVAEVLQYAHALGVAHRNLTPSNVLVVPGEPGTVRVIDFEAAMPRGDAASPPVSAQVAGPPGADEDVRALGVLLSDLVARVPGERVDELRAIARKAAVSAGGAPYDSVSALSVDLVAWLSHVGTSPRRGRDSVEVGDLPEPFE